MGIRLMVVTEQGDAYEVTDDLESYDLSKVMASSVLINEITGTLACALADQQTKNKEEDNG